MIARFLKETSFVFLIGVFPIIYIYAHNIFHIPFEQILEPVAISLIASLILLLPLLLIYRNNVKAAIILSAFWLFFYSYGPLHAFLTDSFDYSFFTRHTFILLILFGIFALICVTVFKWLLPANIIKIANVFTIALLLVPILKIGSYQISEATNPFNAKYEFSSAEYRGIVKDSLPDIVYLMLDGYGREDILRKNYGLDIGPFIDSLRQEDFFIASGSHSNYCRTAASTASMLNLNYLQDLENYNEKQSYNTLDLLAEKSYLLLLLKMYEYNMYSFASGSFITELRVNTQFLTPHPSNLTDFHYLILNSTPFIIVMENAFMLQVYIDFLHLFSGIDIPNYNYRDHQLHRINYAFDEIPAYIGKASPSFVFADIFAGHPPFIFDENGNYITPTSSKPGADGSEFMEANPGGREEYIQGYRGQISYLNKRILTTIEQLKKNSTRPTIIILQGDHGPGGFYHQHDVAQTDADDRFSILSAIYLSDGKKTDIPQDLTPVNTFRVILNSYFNANLPLLPNRSFYSGILTPCTFIEVTDSLTQTHKAQTYSE